MPEFKDIKGWGPRNQIKGSWRCRIKIKLITKGPLVQQKTFSIWMYN